MILQPLSVFSKVLLLSIKNPNRLRVCRGELMMTCIFTPYIQGVGSHLCEGMLTPIPTYFAQTAISVPSLFLPYLSFHWKMKQLSSLLASMFCSQLIVDYQHPSSLERLSSPYSLHMTFSAYTWRKIVFHLCSSFPSSILSLFSEFILSWGFSCSFKVMRIINHCIWVTGSYIYFCIHLPQSLNHCRSVLSPSEETKKHFAGISPSWLLLE